MNKRKNKATIQQRKQRKARKKERNKEGIK